jgi:DNA uptake protein ComE-like DNA-binding protein
MRWILKEFDNFSKQEKRSLFLILLLTFAGLLLRLWLSNREPEPIVISEQQQKEIEDFISSLQRADSNTMDNYEIPANNNERDIRYFYFDPNQDSESDLHDLGLQDYVVKNILKYRKAGGYFNSPDDFRKIYGLEKDEFERISPWIKLHKRQLSDIDSMIAEPVYKKDIDREPEEERKIEINTVKFSELMQIRGMSAEIAGRIIKYRELLGGYYSLHQLREVYGMEGSLFSTLEDKLIVSPEVINKFSLRDVEYKQLLRHPYINKDQVNQIFQLKEFYGDSISLRHIITNKIIDDSLLIQLSPYIEQ